MRPKSFKLGRLLEIRRLRERQQQASLAAAVRARRDQEEALEAILARQVEVRDQLREILAPREHPGGRPGAIPLDEVSRQRAFLSVLSQRAGEAAAPLPELRQREDRERERLAEASRAVKALEKLQQRRRDAFRRWTRRKQQNTLDDTASARAARNPLPCPPRGPAHRPGRRSDGGSDR